MLIEQSLGWLLVPLIKQLTLIVALRRVYTLYLLIILLNDHTVPL